MAATPDKLMCGFKEILPKHFKAAATANDCLIVFRDIQIRPIGKQRKAANLSRFGFALKSRHIIKAIIQSWLVNYMQTPLDLST